MDNVRTLLLSFVSQSVEIATSKEDFTYGVIRCVPCFRLYQPGVSSDVSGRGIVSYHRATFPGGQYKLVCLILGQYFG